MVVVVVVVANDIIDVMQTFLPYGCVFAMRHALVELFAERSADHAEQIQLQQTPQTDFQYQCNPSISPLVISCAANCHSYDSTITLRFYG